MDIIIRLAVGLAAFGVAVYAAVRRRAVLAALAAVAFLVFAFVGAGETFGVVNL